MIIDYGKNYENHKVPNASRLLTVISQMSLEGQQQLLILPKNMSSRPVFSGAHVARPLVFFVVFCKSLFAILSLIFWSLHCLVLVRSMASDYPFGIYFGKLFRTIETQNYTVLQTFMDTM